MSELWLGEGDSKPQVFKAAPQPFGRALPIQLVEEYSQGPGPLRAMFIKNENEPVNRVFCQALQKDGFSCLTGAFACGPMVCRASCLVTVLRPYIRLPLLAGISPSPGAPPSVLRDRRRHVGAASGCPSCMPHVGAGAKSWIGEWSRANLANTSCGQIRCGTAAQELYKIKRLRVANPLVERPPSLREPQF